MSAASASPTSVCDECLNDIDVADGTERWATFRSTRIDSVSFERTLTHRVCPDCLADPAFNADGYSAPVDEPYA